MKRMVLIAILVGVGGVVSAADYYVATTGVDTHAGTSVSSPFKTISKAASIMTAGDTCYIRGGTYRETVTLPRSGTAGSPIRFQAYSNEAVTISGLDQVSGWSLHENDIYKTTISEASQLFVDGSLMSEARWPNTSTDYFSPTYQAVDSANVGAYDAVSTLTDAPLDNFSNGYWTGAKMWYLGGSEWGACSALITDHTGDTLTFNNTSTITSLNIIQGSSYYLYGTLNALDTENEWFYDGSQLYFKAPGSVDPDSISVEVRTRRYSFNMGSQNYVEVVGLNLFAATVKMEGSHCLVENCRILYPTPYFDQKIWGGDDGVELDGSYNTVRRSEIAYSWGDGVTTPTGSDNNTVENCLIHDCNWNGGWAAPINTKGDAHTFAKNRIYNAGRSAVRFYSTTRMTLINNHISDIGWLTKDLGVVKTGGGDSLGSIIAYNWMHDHHSKAWVSGIYLDTGDAENYVLHHNVVWNLDNAIRMNRDCRHNQVYNNTLYNSSKESMAQYNPAGEVYTDIRTYNNVGTTGPFRGTDLQNNLKDTAVDFRYAGEGHGDFRLLEGSSAVDYGRIIDGYTAGYAGVAPDAGAYELGGTDWIPGIDWTPDWNALPVAAFSHVGDTFNALASTDSDGFIMRYDWNFGDGSSGIGKTVLHTYASKGTYAVVLTVMDDLHGITATTNSITIVETRTFTDCTDLFMESDGTKHDTDTLLAGKPVSGTNLLDARRAFLYFDLSELGTDSISNAVLRLYHIEGDGDTWGNASLYAVTSSWNDGNVIFDQPVGPSLGILVGHDGPFNQYIEFDVTDLVKGWQTGSATNYGFCIRGAEAFGITAKYFVSSEGSVGQRPEMLVEYSVPDGDGDGMDDSWELQYFSNLTTASANTDWDSDGFFDYAEFMAGTIPTNPASLMAFSNAVQAAGSERVVYWYSVTNKSYYLARTTNILGAWTNISGSVTASPPVNVYTDSTVIVKSPVFYRLHLE